MKQKEARRKGVMAHHEVNFHDIFVSDEGGFAPYQDSLIHNSLLII
jgi:hypothetical protein